MSDHTEDSARGRVNRRTLLKMSAVGGISVTAGCIGGDDTESDDHSQVQAGARVPEFHFEYETGFGDSTALYERIGPIIEENIEEYLGIPVDFYPKEGTTHQEEQYADARNTNLHFDGEIHVPYWFVEYDPGMYHFNVEDAGEGVTGAEGNYVNCKYSELIYEQRRASDEEERAGLIRETMSIMSEGLC